jgi:hypothetical protein
MTYKTLRQHCQELLETKRYDELQLFLSSEREKIAGEMSETLAFIPAGWPNGLISLYARLLALVWSFTKNRPSLLKEEAWLANQNRRLMTILEMEQKLLEALNQEARTLAEEARRFGKGEQISK